MRNLPTILEGMYISWKITSRVWRAWMKTHSVTRELGCIIFYIEIYFSKKWNKMRSQMNNLTLRRDWSTKTFPRNLVALLSYSTTSLTVFKNMRRTSGSPAGPWVWWWPWPGRLAAPTSEATSWGWSPTPRSPRPPWLWHSYCCAFGDTGSHRPCRRPGSPPTHPGAPEHHRETKVSKAQWPVGIEEPESCGNKSETRSSAWMNILKSSHGIHSISVSLSCSCKLLKPSTEML